MLVIYCDLKKHASAMEGTPDLRSDLIKLCWWDVGSRQALRQRSEARPWARKCFVVQLW